MGELARKYGSPKMAETPLELLTLRPGEGYSMVDKYLWPALGACGGFASSLGYNAITRRPLWSGLPRHVIFIGVSLYMSILLRDYGFAARAESDAVLKHYISLHPEDFPPFESERKRWSEVYLPFQPER